MAGVAPAAAPPAAAGLAGVVVPAGFSGPAGMRNAMVVAQGGLIVAAAAASAAVSLSLAIINRS